MKNKTILSLLLITTILNANESTISKNFILTNISFNIDEDGNLNPNIFLPIYYGNSKQFYSAVGYSSTNSQEVKVLDNFSESKNAFISSSKDLTINYVSYKSTLFSYSVFVGLESTFTNTTNTEFGYIHDSKNLFGKGDDYYISFDNNVELDIKRHALVADIFVPMGKYFSSKFFTSISPYTTIGVKQSTIFKPLVNETGTSSSSTSQDVAYTLRYDGLIKTGTFFDIGLVVYYDNQPLKYNIAQIAQNNNNYLFETNTIDVNKITTKFLVKILLDVDIIGELNPSIGYGIEKIKKVDNVMNETDTIEKKVITFGFERIF